MSGKGSAVNTGDLQGRTTWKRCRAGVRVVIVAKRAGNAAGAKDGRKENSKTTARSYRHCVSAHRADRRKVNNPLQTDVVSAEHSQNKRWPTERLPHGSAGLMNCLPARRAIFEAVTLQLESRMREIRQSGSEGGAAQLNVPFLPLSVKHALDHDVHQLARHDDDLLRRLAFHELLHTGAGEGDCFDLLHLFSPSCTPFAPRSLPASSLLWVL